MPRLIRYYLSEEPLIDNVETFLCREEISLQHVLANLDKLVVKAVGESGGYGITIGPRATAAELEIARAALEATDAHHEIERFDSDPAFRDRLSARVGEHLKVLRRKIIERGLVRPGIRLSDEVAVGVLIENGTIAASDLARLSDPAWCSRQEDLWWTQA